MPETSARAGVVDVLVRNRERFLSFLAARVGGREAAQDVFQSALLKGLDKAAGIRDDESAVAWFYRVLRNAVIDFYRHRAVENRALQTLARDAAAHPPVFEAELENAVCQCVTGLLSNLKPEYAVLLRRVDLDGVRLAEAAREAGITANNAGVRLHRARAALRRELRASCGACAEHGCLDCRCRRS